MSSTLLPLFDTQRAAHMRIAPTKEKIYAHILSLASDRGKHGFTADEIASEWNCDHNQVTPRISELKKAGKLVPSARTRPTRKGYAARVFVLPEFAW
jgi:hypothetical protein